MEFLYKELTDGILGAAFAVHATLGSGFLERVYSDALCIELRERGIAYEKEKVMNITYRGYTLPHAFIADIVVDSKVILELKAVRAIDSVHVAQLINYLKGSGLKVGYVIDFGEPRMKFQRIVV